VPEDAGATKAWTATVLSLFPDMFPGPLGHSLAGKALESAIWRLEVVDFRGYARDKHRSVDDSPAGGGAGMVLRPDVLAAALDFARPARGAGALHPAGAPTPAMDEDLPVLAMTPRGKPLKQARVRELAAGAGVVLVCGRFEGFDERIFAARAIEEVSAGDIVLSGGEPAALMLLEACIRLLPGVMGAASSGAEESFENGLLEYPHYTRPVTWEGRTIPEVLRSGDHAKIAAWRKQRAEDDTRSRRPDLWERHIGARDLPASGARHDDEEDGR